MIKSTQLGYAYKRKTCKEMEILRGLWRLDRTSTRCLCNLISFCYTEAKSPQFLLLGFHSSDSDNIFHSFSDHEHQEREYLVTCKWTEWEMRALAKASIGTCHIGW